jgi:uncharacterized protein with ParB-like and HNH nuclease domain
MASGTIRRDGETPIYADYCTTYCIVDDVCEPKMTRADYPQALQECSPRVELSGPQDIRIPSWQRKLVWSKEQVEKLVTSESSMFGTVIIAKGETDSDSWTLIDGLQRFSVGTALLNALYDEVLAPVPKRQTDEKYFAILKKGIMNLQPVFEWNHKRLSNLGKRGVRTSYNELFEEIKEYVNEKLNENAEEFGKEIVTAFMIKQIAVDPYSGFSKTSDLIKTFLSINSTGESLTPTDLLRAKILEHLEQSLRFKGSLLDEIENDFTETFQDGKGKYFRDLGVNTYNIMFELPDTSFAPGTSEAGKRIDGHSPKYIFPNWEEIEKKDFDEFFTYHQKVEDLAKKISSGKWIWPYMSEIFPFKLPYIMMTMYYYKNHFSKFLTKKDEFVGKKKFEYQAESEKITLHELQTRYAAGTKINFTASEVKAKQEILEITNGHSKIKSLQDDLLNAIDNKEPEEIIEEIGNKIHDLEDKEQEFPNLFDELPDFLGGDLDTQQDLKKFYRAVMRKVLDGNIGKTEKILHRVLRGHIKSMDELSSALNPDGAGDIDDKANGNWLKQVILKSKKKSANPRIIFNSCLLPKRDESSKRDDFQPMIFKNGANYYNIDHLIPDDDANKDVRGHKELQNLVNLAPLESPNNVTASDTLCSLKLSSSKIYGTMKDKHPYCKWLIEDHFPAHNGEELVFPLSGKQTPEKGEESSIKIHRFDSQVNLLEADTNSISNERVEKLIEILTSRL